MGNDFVTPTTESVRRIMWCTVVPNIFLFFSEFLDEFSFLSTSYELIITLRPNFSIS